MAEIKKTDSMSEGLKAEINKQRKEQGQKGIGEYAENAGGGTPGTGKRGGMHSDHTSNPETRNFLVFDSPDDPLAQEAKDEGIAVRYDQPRKENGQFTYNSANAKGLSTKTSRGYTDPPFLEGVNLTFITKGSTFKYEKEINEYEKDENGNVVADEKGNPVHKTKTKRVISTIDMTSQQLVNSCKVYFKTEGGFLGVIGTGITKKGRQSKQEEQAELGKTGETDLSTKSQSTQQEAQQAEQNKKTSDLEKQKAISRFRALLKQKDPEAQIGTRNGVGVGAGVGNDNNIPPDNDDDDDDLPPNDGGNDNPPSPPSGESGSDGSSNSEPTEREYNVILDAINKKMPELNVTLDELKEMFKQGIISKDDFEEELADDLLK